MALTLMPWWSDPFLDTNGNPLASGTVETYSTASGHMEIAMGPDQFGVAAVKLAKAPSGYGMPTEIQQAVEIGPGWKTVVFKLKKILLPPDGGTLPGETPVGVYIAAGVAGAVALGVIGAIVL